MFILIIFLPACTNSSSQASNSKIPSPTNSYLSLITQETFIPMESNTVKWYTCGPTVYSNSHMGHARYLICYSGITSAMIWSGESWAIILDITFTTVWTLLMLMIRLSTGPMTKILSTFSLHASGKRTTFKIWSIFLLIQVPWRRSPRLHHQSYRVCPLNRRLHLKNHRQWLRICIQWVSLLQYRSLQGKV